METLPTLRETDIVSLLATAIERNTPIETLERIVALRHQLKAEWAEEQFNLAKSALQAEMPVIQKTKPVRTKDGKIAYRYAPIEKIIPQVQPLLTKYGFSFSFQTYTYADSAKAVCVVNHRCGYKDEKEMELPFIERTQLMSQAHVVEGTLTICIRKAFCNAFGIVTDVQDENGVLGGEIDKCSGEVVDQIEELIQQKGFDREKMLSNNKVNSFSEFTQVQGESFLNVLQKAKSKKG